MLDSISSAGSVQGRTKEELLEQAKADKEFAHLDLRMPVYLLLFTINDK